MDEHTSLAAAALAQIALCLARAPVAPFLDALRRVRAEPASAAVPVAGRPLPVLQYWAPALAAAALVDAPLAQALAALAPALSWRQNPNYVRRPPDAAFLDAYGYAVIAGPGGLIAAPIAAGVLLLGPDTLYPAHVHPAEEIYLVLDAGSAWWREGEGWRGHLPGAVIHHPPSLAHAMRAGSGPLLAAYLWRGDLDTAAALVA